MNKTFLKQGQSSQAPEVLAEQAPSWSGKQEQELTDNEVREICEYASEEGVEVGFEDGRTGTLIKSNASPFHQEFLGGVPHMLWKMGYRNGVSMGTRGKRVLGQLLTLSAA